jgi:hypothetical protein
VSLCTLTLWTVPFLYIYKIVVCIIVCSRQCCGCSLLSRTWCIVSWWVSAALKSTAQAVTAVFLRATLRIAMLFFRSMSCQSRRGPRWHLHMRGFSMSSFNHMARSTTFLLSGNCHQVRGIAAALLVKLCSSRHACVKLTLHAAN